jgi:hypothetical protein
MEQKTSGLSLARSEFLVLMDAVKAPAVVGLDTASLVPADKEQHKALVLAGLESLKQRDLMRVEGDVHVLDPRLLALAMAVGHPDVASITRKDTPGRGSQLFLHYLAPPIIVEHTLPSEQHHRLAPLADMPTLIERLLAILPVPEARALPEERGRMTMDAFLTLKGQAEGGDRAGAQAAAQAGGLSAAGAASLVSALAAPVFGGTIGLLKTTNDEVEDARNLALVQGQDAAWLVRQTTPGAETFDLATTDGLEVRKLLVQWFAELSVRASSLLNGCPFSLSHTFRMSSCVSGSKNSRSDVS